MGDSDGYSRIVRHFRIGLSERRAWPKRSQERGLRVNTVSSGVIHTDGVERVLRGTARRLSWGDEWKVIQRRWFEDILSDKVVKRLGTVEEVAQLVAFVPRPRADDINRANLRIDGGKSPSVN